MLLNKETKLLLRLCKQLFKLKGEYLKLTSTTKLESSSFSPSSECKIRDGHVVEVSTALHTEPRQIAPQ